MLVAAVVMLSARVAGRAFTLVTAMVMMLVALIRARRALKLASAWATRLFFSLLKVLAAFPHAAVVHLETAFVFL